MQPADEHGEGQMKWEDDEDWERGPSKEERTMAMVCNLAALSAFVGVPFGNVLGPLIIWIIKKDEMPFVDYHGKEAINFQISLTMYLILSAILWIVLIGFALSVILGIACFVLPIIAGLKANDGVYYRYPFTVRFIK